MVDESKETQQYSAELLEAKGYIFATATSAEDTLDINRLFYESLRDFNFPVVLTNSFPLMISEVRRKKSGIEGLGIWVEENSRDKIESIQRIFREFPESVLLDWLQRGEISRIESLLADSEPREQRNLPLNLPDQWVAENKQLVGRTLKAAYLRKIDRLEETEKMGIKFPGTWIGEYKQKAESIPGQPLTAPEVFSIVGHKVAEILTRNPQLRPE